MSAELRLILFDVDGTLVDSQGDIVAAMSRAFAAVGEAAPEREAILSIVGLSLEVALPRLAPALPAEAHAEMVAAYKAAYLQLRKEQGTTQSSPLYPHARNVLTQLAAVDHYLLGVATGKSRRGLDALLQGHQLEQMFLTQQVSDHHPSKPHPAMIEAALGDFGLTPEQAVMIGDTTYDLEMARAAGVRAIGVDWGYHQREALQPLADLLVSDFRQLPAAIEDIWRHEA